MADENSLVYSSEDDLSLAKRLTVDDFSGQVPSYQAPPPIAIPQANPAP